MKAGEAFEGGAMGDALTGCLQLSINNSPSPLFRAFVLSIIHILFRATDVLHLGWYTPQYRI